METKARFYNRIGILAAFALMGIVGAVVLYYGMFFVLALALAALIGHNRTRSKVVEFGKNNSKQTAPANPAGK